MAPARKASDPPLYHAKHSRPWFHLITRFKLPLITVAAAAFLLFVLYPHLQERSALGTGRQATSRGSPPVVLVTALVPSLSPSLRQMVKDNRRLYASKHGMAYLETHPAIPSPLFTTLKWADAILGYKAFFPKISVYNLTLPSSPPSWAKVPAMRHAMTLFPHATYYWYLDWTVFIMNTSLSVDGHIMDPARLENIMLVDHPVIPPDGIIKTLAHRKAGHVDLVLTHDHEGLSPGSFIIRRGEWANYFLDSWFDPLYREYEFQRVERHALEHLVQWHSTVLSRLALIPQRMLNSYAHGTDEEMYKDGDFVANLHGCEEAADRDCDIEAQELARRVEDSEDSERDQ